MYHGFLLTPHGKFTTFDAPDAGTGAFQGSGGLSVNAAGTILGEYFDTSNVSHSFLRAPDGTITEFDAPGAGTEPHQGAYPANLSGINPEGASVGEIYDANWVNHGYLRSPDGTITDVDVPGAGTGTYQGTNACWFIPAWGGINPAGTITGFYADENSVYHGYVRTLEGKITRFDAPGAGSTAAWQGTQPMTINPEGAITGYYTDANNVVHGFLRPAVP